MEGVEGTARAEGRHHRRGHNCGGHIQWEGTAGGTHGGGHSQGRRRTQRQGWEWGKTQLGGLMGGTARGEGGHSWGAQLGGHSWGHTEGTARGRGGHSGSGGGGGETQFGGHMGGTDRGEGGHSRGEHSWGIQLGVRGTQLGGHIQQGGTARVGACPGKRFHIYLTTCQTPCRRDWI